MSGNSEKPKTFELEDETVLEIFREIPIPTELVQANVWLRYRRRMARDRDLQRVLDGLIEEMNRLIDLFRRTPENVGERGETGE